MLWITLLVTNFNNYSFANIVQYTDDHQNMFFLVVPLLALLSYPLGIIITSLSFRFSHLTLYRWFVNGVHSNEWRTRHVQAIAHISNEVSNKQLVLKNKTTELEILGGCWVNSFFTAITLVSLGHKLSALVGLLLTISFALMLIEKYRSWIRTVARHYDKARSHQRIESNSKSCTDEPT